MTCEETVRAALAGLAEDDEASYAELIAPRVDWEISDAECGPARLARDELPDHVKRLRATDDRRVVKEIVTIRETVVVRSEGTITPGDITFGGSGMATYECEGGQIVRRRVFAYRKAVLDSLGLSRDERRGLLVVRDDADARLSPFNIQPGSALTWANYADLGRSDHDHCELCWQKFCAFEDEDEHVGYATLDGRHWLCADCFDEVRDHFRLWER